MNKKSPTDVISGTFYVEETAGCLFDLIQQGCEFFCSRVSFCWRHDSLIAQHDSTINDFRWLACLPMGIR